jgi:hypothetical protein
MNLLELVSGMSYDHRLTDTEIGSKSVRSAIRLRDRSEPSITYCKVAIGVSQPEPSRGWPRSLLAWGRFCLIRFPLH